MRIVTAFVFSILLATSANAQSITKLTAENVGATFATNGFRFLESADNRGYPLIQVETGGLIHAENINVFFYGCVPEGCEDITLYSWYEPATPVTAAQINTWNDIFQSTRNWSRAYIDDEGDVILVMNINATGGIGPDALQILINTYLVEAQDFGVWVGAETTQ